MYFYSVIILILNNLLGFLEINFLVFMTNTITQKYLNVEEEKGGELRIFLGEENKKLGRCQKISCLLWNNDEQNAPSLEARKNNK